MPICVILVLPSLRLFALAIRLEFRGIIFWYTLIKIWVMRIKVLMLGNDPGSIIADERLLRDRGMIVLTSFNMLNLAELINETKPDILFFDAQLPSKPITETYNDIVNSIYFTSIPVIFTLSEDDVYLVTRKRTEGKDKRNMIADNIIDAVKMALQGGRAHSTRSGHSARNHTASSIKGNLPNAGGSQLSLPIYFQ